DAKPADRRSKVQTAVLIVQTAVLIVQTAVLIAQTALVSELYPAMRKVLSRLLNDFNTTSF
ncbi:MAG: hypothetical protein IKH69_07995, partial [Bacteroidaceae bacterium]|nr:hypothetical protein [Bacteroidaceae bacterium]